MKKSIWKKVFSWDQRKARVCGSFSYERIFIKFFTRHMEEEFRLIKKESVNSIRAVSAVL